jgi:hypothetical protein
MATEQYYIWYEMVMVQNTYGTKCYGFWLWYEIAIMWYEMVNYDNGTKSWPTSGRPTMSRPTRTSITWPRHGKRCLKLIIFWD